MTTRCMHIACWIPMAINTHSQYVMLTAFPQQHWLHEPTSILRYTVCPTRYQTRHFFNNFTTNEDVAMTTDTHYRHTTDTHYGHTHTTDTDTHYTHTHYKHTLHTRTTDTHYRHIPLHFSHNKRTPVQISLQYLHWC